MIYNLSKTHTQTHTHTQREETQITSIRKERRDTQITDLTNIKKKIGKYNK